ncbi:MAG: VCBS repeat-containing protein, partial [Saprospiraceae bacterium]|nr:VCBS repeat-containing protein [Saprospiraceae bacterium]
TGQFSYSKDQIPAIKSSGSKVRACDFDLDGDLDLLVGGRHIPWSYPEPASSFLLVNENGVLIDKSAELAPDLKDIGIINDIKWVDLNQDERQDIVLVGEWTSIIILENTTEGFKRLTGTDLDNQKGWWFSVEASDIDADGDQDLLLGNLGLNYKYKASDSEPFEVYYYDFDENGSKDVVLTYYNFGIQYPLRGRECSSQQIPAIKEEFTNYDLFASSDVSDIYGESKLEQALHLEANNFASIYAENIGNGNFRISQLPVEAQVSSINDFVVDDFNGDHHLDVLLAGNLYDAEVETARADAGWGLLLLGDGKGGFETASKMVSGFYLPYDVKSLIPIKSGDEKMILAGCNNDKLRVFHYK